MRAANPQSSPTPGRSRLRAVFRGSKPGASPIGGNRGVARGMSSRFCLDNWAGFLSRASRFDTVDVGKGGRPPSGARVPLYFPADGDFEIKFAHPFHSEYPKPCGSQHAAEVTFRSPVGPATCSLDTFLCTPQQHGCRCRCIKPPLRARVLSVHASADLIVDTGVVQCCTTKLEAQLRERTASNVSSR